MTYEAVICKAREGAVIRRRSWHHSQAVMLFDGEFEWVDPSWTGPIRRDIGAALENKDFLASDWEICGGSAHEEVVIHETKSI